MNRVATLALVSAFSSLALAGVSRAESFGMNSPSGIEQTLRNFRGNDFTVRHFYNFHDVSPEANGPRSAPPRSAQDVRQIQASIDANKVLMRKLGNDGVNVRNVINAEQAADGSITLFTD
ncbi:hypothetical protein AM571_CH01381 [Rhizobium etli 8C-3]|uniref:Uncharacterized protein n=2 Tax=Rhizobium TaxID=379 RepID=A0A1L5P261_RHIET|nr:MULTISPECIES: hypothetical protein [Rhizobium]APO74217.1 hypothetical protein AM571_CH01381 [Rhizobium etli 8C-3]TCU23023.1 hypothetical protein EV130_108165 [Rhizobium azibense]